MHNIKNHIRSNNVQMVALIEPKISTNRLDKVRHRLNFDNATSNMEENSKI